MTFSLGARAAALGLWFLTGCSSMSVESDHDATASFQGYQTYQWADNPSAAASMIPPGSLNDVRIRRAVDDELVGKGMGPSISDPDLFVQYHVNLEDMVQVWDDRWVTPRGWQAGDVSVTNYTEGTLFIDLIDARQGNVIWRGWATGAVDQNTSNIEERLRKVVQKILDRYPPG